MGFLSQQPPSQPSVLLLLLYHHRRLANYFSLFLLVLPLISSGTLPLRYAWRACAFSARPFARIFIVTTLSRRAAVEANHYLSKSIKPNKIAPREQSLELNRLANLILERLLLHFTFFQIWGWLFGRFQLPSEKNNSLFVLPVWLWASQPPWLVLLVAPASSQQPAAPVQNSE